MLRSIFIIFILCTTRLFSQLNAPDLRCLEVLANGDVKLTWIPPADLNNEFFEYEIHQSNFKNGPYNPLLTSLTSITTNSFVHTTTVTGIGSSFYFMVTKYGPGGANSSLRSDTLRTIFLTAFSNLTNGTQDIQFNKIRNPKLPTTSNSFVLNKEYPLGTWNILANTTNTVYPDTITVCKAKMNYQAVLSDQSGCVSVSNMLKAEYQNSKDPEQPYVDSISVLPNGNTTIAWQIPVDKDIDKYIIQYLVGTINQTIDIVPGRNSTSYVYTTTTANFSSVGLFVQAQDSCVFNPRSSTVNYQLRTMFLQTAYNRCAYQTVLKWNKYIWSDIKGVPVESMGEYRIYYSVNGSAFNLIGKTTDTNFVHNDVAPGKNICYFVRVINKRETITASSNRSCFFSDQVLAPKFIYIKTATVLDRSSAEIRVYLDTSQNSKGFNVLRSENEADYTTIGFIPYNGTPNYSYKDEQITPSLKSYSYKVIIIDSCGNARGSSNTAKTILLKVHGNEEQIFTKQLSWTEYKGFDGGISGYNVYRVVNDEINAALIGSTDPITTNYTDNLEDAAPQGAKIEYIVQAVEGIGNTYGIFERSSSNPVSVYMDGNMYVPNAFAPAGVNKTWLPVTHFVEKTDYHVRVFNRWGKKVFETNDDTVAWDGTDCIAGVYVYLIDYKNSRGEYLEVKGSVLLLR